MIVAMNEHGLALEEAAREAESERERKIYELRQDAISASERGWRGLGFTVVDSLAAGVVAGLLTMAGVLTYALAVVSPQLGRLRVFFIGAAPLVAYAVIMLFVRGPLHGANTLRRRGLADLLLIIWLVGLVVLFAVSGLSVATGP